MRKWEYLLYRIDSESLKTRHFDRLGIFGWELVTTVENTAFFKRPITKSINERDSPSEKSRCKFLRDLTVLTADYGLSVRCYNTVARGGWGLSQDEDIYSCWKYFKRSEDGEHLDFYEWCEFVLEDPTRIRSMPNMGPTLTRQLVIAIKAYKADNDADI